MRTRAVPAFVFLVLCACNGGTPESQGTDLAADGAGMEVVDSGAPGEDRGETDLVPDGPPPADAGADAPPACTPGTGCFLDPCTGNGDCLSGWCVTHLGSGVCTQACQEDCPPGWTCRQVAGTGPD
ncbi:MAG: hypothetical protein FJ098_16040, partial [Deltaproteobacteria bacterium]|nr:hypothetical protein [Deltaproteobacteria bacterium]